MWAEHVVVPEIERLGDSSPPSEYEYRIFVAGQTGMLKGAEMGGKPLEGGRAEARGMS